jgi:hypothetical protein
LIYLIDRCGKPAEIYLRLHQPGEYSKLIMSAVGTLQHWSQSDGARPNATSTDSQRWAELSQISGMKFDLAALDVLELDFEEDGRPWSYVPLADGLDVLLVWSPGSITPGSSQLPD